MKSNSAYLSCTKLIFISIVVGDSIIKGGWNPINWINPATFLYLSKARTWFIITIFCACPKPGPVVYHHYILCLSKARTWFIITIFCACLKPGPGLSSLYCVPVQSQDLVYHHYIVCLSKARTWFIITIFWWFFFCVNCYEARDSCSLCWFA